MRSYRSSSKGEKFNRGAPYSPRRIETRHGREEFGLGKKNILVCPEDGLVYFQKSWHHRFEDIKNLKEGLEIRFEMCPVSKMKKRRLYEGVLAVQHLPASLAHELLRLVKNFGDLAFHNDPLDQILRLESTGGEYRVYVSENQMVVKLARKILSAFKKHTKGHLSFTHAPGDVVRGVIEFK